MKTTKPFSTISYNSKEFLETFLNQLVSEKIISFWCAIHHDGEHLDNGKEQTCEKDHFHVYIEPNVKVNTMDIIKLSCEPDPNNPEHPLKFIYCRPSKWVDWLWYGLHDSDYLAMKMEEREFCYSLEDFLSSDYDEFFERSSQALHDSDVFASLRVKRFMKTHTVAQLVAMGMVTPKDASCLQVYEKLFHLGELELDNGRSVNIVKEYDLPNGKTLVIFDDGSYKEFYKSPLTDRVPNEQERLRQLAENIELYKDIY